MILIRSEHNALLKIRDKNNKDQPMMCCLHMQQAELLSCIISPSNHSGQNHHAAHSVPVKEHTELNTQEYSKTGLTGFFVFVSVLAMEPIATVAPVTTTRPGESEW